MKKEQLADNVTLFCGDARDVIPLLGRLDKTALVSDPPYGIEDLVTGYGRTYVGITHRKIANDKNLDVTSEVFALLRKQLRNAWLASFYSCRISAKFFEAMKDFEYFGEVIWDKRAPGFGAQIRYQHENVAFFKIGKPKELNDTMSVISYATMKGENKSDHPHEKPHQVMLNIVGAVPGGVVIDPFMGTGSTGAAAVQLKRGFIGIEVDPKHFDIARKKIGAAIKQPMAFYE